MASIALLKKNSLLRRIKKQKFLLMFLLPGVVLFTVFSYLPLYGLVGAFQDFNPVKGFFGSPFVGFKNFIILFALPDFKLVVRNTLAIGFWTLIFTFPAPIILALAFKVYRFIRSRRHGPKQSQSRFGAHGDDNYMYNPYPGDISVPAEIFHSRHNDWRDKRIIFVVLS